VRCDHQLGHHHPAAWHALCIVPYGQYGLTFSTEGQPVAARMRATTRGRRHHHAISRTTPADLPSPCARREPSRDASPSQTTTAQPRACQLTSMPGLAPSYSATTRAGDRRSRVMASGSSSVARRWTTRGEPPITAWFAAIRSKACSPFFPQLTDGNREATRTRPRLDHLCRRRRDAGRLPQRADPALWRPPVLPSTYWSCMPWRPTAAVRLRHNASITSKE